MGRERRRVTRSVPGSAPSANGYTVGQAGKSPRGPFVYFAEERHPGTVIEMAQLTPVRRRIFD